MRVLIIRHLANTMPILSAHPIRATAALSLVVALGVLPAGASAETTIVAKGAGFGHGIGMSQYGAYGQAKAGRTANQILTHYYTGTQVAKGDTARTVRVLLRSSSSVRFSGAASLVSTTRKLSPDATYVLKSSGSTVTLTSSSGKKIASASNAMRVAAPSGGALK
ncbi:MAG: hypothetical protein Q7T55_17645, partial [Solirubrobacteraceae bacterium]|nr:hypothetical protein [Solirubrobacteraceae bacterium]